MDESPVSGISASHATASVRSTHERMAVTVGGEVDLAFAERGLSIVRMAAAENKPVDVDLSGVTLFGAAGVSWLVSLYGAVEADVRVVAATGHVRAMLELCGVPTSSSAWRAAAMDTAANG